MIFPRLFAFCLLLVPVCSNALAWSAEDEAPAKVPAADAPAAAEQPQTQPLTAEEIATAIGHLGDESYTVREEATHKLAKAGATAVPALQAAAVGDAPLEVAARAIRILQIMYQNGDSDAYDAAEIALEQIAESRTNRVLARRAQVAITTQVARRQIRAIARFKELGGRVRMVQPNGVAITGVNGEPQISELIIGREWKGGEVGLAQIKRLTAVRALYVINNALTEDEITKLTQALPQLVIQHRGQAMLGVSALPNEKGCEIFNVKEGSAAEQAELEAGDIITRFDGKEVKTFEALTDLIKTKKGGDKVIIDLIRNGEAMNKEVTLGDWE